MCDGNDASGVQSVGLAVQLSTSYVASELSDPLSPARLAIDSAMVTLLSSALQRPPASIVITSVSLASRRLALSPARMVSSQSVAVQTSLLPYGGANNLPQSSLAAALQAANTSSSLVSVSSVTSVSTSAVCGNGVCEVGERPGGGVVGCPVDCPYPVLTCPVANGVACNNAGACVALSSSSSSSSTTFSGVCSCRVAQGYSGAACDGCTSGFVALAGACVKVESGSHTTTTVVAAPASSHFPYVVVGAAAGGFVVVAVSAIVWYFVWGKRLEKRESPTTSGQCMPRRVKVTPYQVEVGDGAA